MIYNTLGAAAVLTLVSSGQAAKCPFTGAESKGDDSPCPSSRLSKASSTPQVTNAGCTCKTPCGASVTHGLANCDWCYTEDKCGDWSLSGYWDYCKYPEDDNYESQSASTKVKDLWSEISANQTSGTYPNLLLIENESIQTTFDNWRDVMPEGREKVIHSVGAVCKFTFDVSSSSPYSGLLSAGSTSEGFIRLGSALPVTEDSGVIPGLGIKMLRSGVHSADYVALVSLDPLPDKNYNFFEEDFSNHIAPAEGATAILAKKFEQASTCVNKVGLSDIAAYDVNGKKAENLVFPWKLTMQSHYQIDNVPMTQEVLQQKLTEIPVGKPLFDITAYETPQSKGVKIGTFTPTETCVNSNFGDASFFIRHQRIEEDWQLHPEWLDGLDAKAECGTKSLSLEPPEKCADKEA